MVQALDKSLDFIINTASGDISFDLYLSLLKTAGVLVLVGFPSEVKFLPGSLNLGMTLSKYVNSFRESVNSFDALCFQAPLYCYQLN